MYVSGLFHCVETKIVGGPKGLPALHSTTGHPDRKSLRMMVAPHGPAKAGISFHHGSAAEFTAPNDERGIKQAALFEVLYEGRAGLIRGFAIAGVISHEVAMGIPAFMVDINETDPAFHHPSCKMSGPVE